MTEDSSIQNEVELWRTKHNLGQDDPLFAVVELVQIHLEALNSAPSKTSPPMTFEECRGTIEDLAKASKEFSSMGRDLLQEIRQRRPASKTSQNSGGFGLAFFGFTMGIVLGAAFAYLYTTGELQQWF